MPRNAHHGGDLRRRIIDAAREELIARGVRFAKTADIAKGADTSESTMFRHFPEGVAGIFRATYDQCWGEINDAMYKASFVDPPSGDPTTDLVKEFEHVWQMRDDGNLTKSVVLAFSFLSRPEALGDNVISEEHDRFRVLITSRCRNLLVGRDAAISADTLARLLINYAASAWLTWQELGQGESDLTQQLAGDAVRGLIDRIAPERKLVHAG
jgi:AcrR family transcriptional regulator